MSSTTTTWSTDTNTKSGSATTYTDTVSSLRLVGGEGEDAILRLFADEGDDNADQWRIVSQASNNKLNFMSYASGAWSNVLSLYGHGTAASQYLSIQTGIKIYLDGVGDTYIQESSADVLDIYVGGANMIKLTESTTDTVTITGDLTVGVNDTGHDVKFFGATATHGYMLWDESTDDLILGSSSKIGIGTTSPAAQLDITDTTTSSATQGGKLRLSSNDDALMSSGDRLGIIEFAGAESGSGVAVGAQIYAIADDAFSASDDYDHPTRLEFSVQSTTSDSNGLTTPRLCIDSDGKVGIGTTSPANNLVLATTSAGPVLELQFNQGGTIDTEVIGQIFFTANESDITTSGGAQADGSSIGAKIVATAAANWGDTDDDDDSPTKLEFFTQSDGAADSLTASRMTILSSGYVGVGIAAPLSPLHIYSSGESNIPILHVEHGEGEMETNDEILRLDASADADIHTTQMKIITIHDAGGEIGKFVTASDGNINTAWTNVSDVRLKKDIQDTSMDGLAIMNSLKLRDFKWNAESGKYRENKQVIGGLIADEVYEVYRQATTGTPGAIKEDGSIDRMGVTESQFITVMMKAIQELSAKVDALENA